MDRSRDPESRRGKASLRMIGACGDVNVTLSPLPRAEVQCSPSARASSSRPIFERPLISRRWASR
jgi:hypothetical protein